MTFPAHPVAAGGPSPQLSAQSQVCLFEVCVSIGKNSHWTPRFPEADPHHHSCFMFHFRPIRRFYDFTPEIVASEAGWAWPPKASCGVLWKLVEYTNFQPSRKPSCHPPLGYLGFLQECARHESLGCCCVTSKLICGESHSDDGCPGMCRFDHIRENLLQGARLSPTLCSKPLQRPRIYTA